MKCSLFSQQQVMIGYWGPFLRFAIGLIGHNSIHHCLYWIESVDKFEVSIEGIIMELSRGPSSFLIWIPLIWVIIQKSCGNRSIILKLQSSQFLNTSIWFLNVLYITHQGRRKVWNPGGACSSCVNGTTLENQHRKREPKCVHGIFPKVYWFYNCESWIS